MSAFTANKLRETREKMGLSQTDVAKMMHINDRTLRKIESNERQVTADEIIEFAKLYKVLSIYEKEH